MFCSQIISSEVSQWQDYSTIFIDAPTGSGKTTFILNSLLPMALRQGREILYLSNRTLLQKQLIKKTCEKFNIPYRDIQDEKIVELPGITFMTYQTLQERLNRNPLLSNVPFYYYLVADEIHYITEDSAFNPKVGRLLEWLPLMQMNTFIAISATIDSALQYLGFYYSGWQEAEESEYRTIYWREPQKMINKLFGKREFLYFYHIKSEKQQYSITVYQTVEDIVEEINNDVSGDKWLIFQSNKELATKRLVKNVKKKCMFISADNKGEKEMQEIVENERFLAEVLVTTKVLDNGVSLHDSKIKKIVLDTTSKTEFQQMLGRRRMCEDDKGPLVLYIPKKSANFFSKMLNENILPALDLIKTPPEFLLEKILKTDETYQMCRKYYDIREGNLVLNPVVKNNLEREKRFYQRMLQDFKDDTYAFVKEQLSWLGKESVASDVVDLVEERRKKEEKILQEYLLTHEGKPMGRQEQKVFREEVKNFFRLLLPELFVSESRTPGIKKINKALACLKIGWKIHSVSGKKKGEETVWILQRKESGFLAT